MGDVNALLALSAIPSSKSDLIASTAAFLIGELTIAEEILIDTQNYSELNEFYQNSGQWTKALALSESDDRIHAQNTIFKFGKTLADKNDVGGAVAFFEKSGEKNSDTLLGLMADRKSMLYSYVEKNPEKVIVC